MTVDSWTQGLEPMTRPAYTGRDQGYLSVMMLLVLGLCLNYRTIKRIWGTLIRRLWKTRVRDDYDHVTGKEKRGVAMLLLSAVFFIALIWNASLTLVPSLEIDFDFLTTLKLAGLVTVYFMFEYVAYGTVGYTFASEEGRQVWMEGFTASMSILGITLVVPGFLEVFYPHLTLYAVIFSATAYVFVKSMFIYKGFRIFYTNLGSVVYFILYLCSLEIIPLIALYYLARIICSL